MKIYTSLIFCILLIISQPVKSQSATDSNKEFKGLLIYVDYPDAPAWIEPDRLDSLINGFDYQEDGAERSFRKYWHEQSRRNVDFTHDIFYYTAPQNASHYESLSWQDGIKLWKDALEWIISTYPEYDWRSLSISDDNFDRQLKGGIASVMVISSKWGPAGVGASHGPRWTLSNGVKINNIQGATLKAPWDTKPVNMFMSLHEAGHDIFAFPDTYDTDGGDEHSGGTGIYSLMSGGKPDVEPIGAPFLAQYNWGYVVEPDPGTHNIVLRADGDSVVVFRNPYDPNEFFSIEARKRNNIGNSLFPINLGLLIWHTDNKVSTSNRLSDMTPQKHYRNSIEQADGRFELERSSTNRGNRGDIYVSGKSFSDNTVPDSKWWDGLSSNFEITNIQNIGHDHISFDVIIPDPPYQLPEIPQSNWTLVSSTPSQGGYNGSMAFDGDLSTYFHVPWGNSYQRPHEIIIDLGQLYIMNEFYYQANTNTSPPWEGRIADYNLYLSEDGNNWGSPVKTGRFFYTGLNQYALFENTAGRYLKFEAINSWIGNGTLNDVRTSIAEIKLRGTTQEPKAIFNASVKDTIVDTPIVFTDLSLDGPTEWLWEFPGGIPETSNQQNPSVVYLDTGSYDVSLTVTNIFGSNKKTEEDYIRINSGLGIETEIQENIIHIYPNPVRDILNIESSVTAEIRIEIFDLSGKSLRSEVLSRDQNINLSELSTGTYILNLKTSELNIQRKIVKYNP